MNNRSGSAPARRSGKASGMKVRNPRELDRYFSRKDVEPINLDNDWMIANGYHPPHQYRNRQAVMPDGRVRQVGRFEKSPEERAALKAVHSHEKGKTGGLITRNNERKYRLIVHFRNTRRSKTFSTTRSIEVAPSQLSVLIRRLHDPDANKIVTKYYYQGKTYVS